MDHAIKGYLERSFGDKFQFDISGRIRLAWTFDKVFYDAQDHVRSCFKSLYRPFSPVRQTIDLISLYSVTVPPNYGPTNEMGAMTPGDKSEETSAHLELPVEILPLQKKKDITRWCQKMAEGAYDSERKRLSFNNVETVVWRAGQAVDFFCIPAVKSAK